MTALTKTFMQTLKTKATEMEERGSNLIYNADTLHETLEWDGADLEGLDELLDTLENCIDYLYETRGFLRAMQKEAKEQEVIA